MKLIEFLNNLIKDDGFLLIDANKNKHLIGKPKKEKLILELNSLNFKI